MTAEPRATVGGGPRPGRAGCECTNEDRHPNGCPRYGTMHDGRFLCQYGCVRHTWDQGDTETDAEWAGRRLRFDMPGWVAREPSDDR